MPRRFSEAEEQLITEQLRRAGRTIMGTRGVRKTTIDELARAAAISKGSFYRFYSSKEELALEILAEWEIEFHGSIEARFDAESPRGGARTAAVLRSVFLEDFPRRVAASGMQGLFDSQEIAYLQQRAGPAHRSRMDQQDTRLFQRLKPLLRRAGLTPAVDDAVIIASLRLLFDGALSTLRAGLESGPPFDADGVLRADHYHEAVGLLIEGFFLRLFDADLPGKQAAEQRQGQGQGEGQRQGIGSDPGTDPETDARPHHQN